MLTRKTKIICTIGPATNSYQIIHKLASAGMDIARLNFSHGTHRQHAAYIKLIRQVSAQLGQPIAILQDMPGPKPRTGILRGKEVRLKENADFVLTSRAIVGDEHGVSINLPSLSQDVSPGDTIFLNDGAIQLQAVAIAGQDVRCRVVVGGVLGAEKGINIPGVTLSVPSVAEESLKHLDFGVKHEVDFIALSFVREAADVLQVKGFLKQRGADTPVIAKIEKHEALANIDDIIAVADGVMVARGDLGVELPVTRVPLEQKEIVRKCNHSGKPAIVATQMLESMVNLPHPTRAEVSDIANAVFEGADAVMLSAETAIGKYPVAATRVMADIAIETETALPYDRILEEKGKDLVAETDDAIAYSACHTASQLGATTIVAYTASGSTAQRVAKYRPRMPILAITYSEAVRRRLTLYWGVCCCLVTMSKTVDDMFAQASRLALDSGVAKSGDLIVVTAGVPIGVKGTTNLLRVQRVD